jgi:hypothetical protein
MSLINEPESDSTFFGGSLQNLFARGAKDWGADAITRVADARALIQKYAVLAREQAASRPKTSAARLLRIFTQMRGRTGSMAPRAQPAKSPAKTSTPVRDEVAAAQPPISRPGEAAPLLAGRHTGTLAALFASAGGHTNALQTAAFAPQAAWLARRPADLVSLARPLGGLAAMRPAASAQARSYAPPVTLRRDWQAADAQQQRGDGLDGPAALAKQNFATADGLKLAPRHLSSASQAGGGVASPQASVSADLHQADLYQALDALFYRESRLAPSGGSAFDPLLTPAWAGLGLGY